MVLWNPLFLWDASFQLRSLRPGLILYGNPLQQKAENLITRYFRNQCTANSKFLSGFFLLTLAAQVHHPTHYGISIQTNLARFINRQPVHPACPTGSDDFGGLAVYLSLIFLPLGQLIGMDAGP